MYLKSQSEPILGDSYESQTSGTSSWFYRFLSSQKVVVYVSSRPVVQLHLTKGKRIRKIARVLSELRLKSNEGQLTLLLTVYLDISQTRINSLQMAQFGVKTLSTHQNQIYQANGYKENYVKMLYRRNPETAFQLCENKEKIDNTQLF